MDELTDLVNFNLLGLLSKIGIRSLLVIIAIEEAGIPLPISGDLFLLTAGRNSLHSSFGLEKVLMATIGGTILGASLLYFLARTLGRALILRYGRYLRIQEQSLERMEAWFQKHGGAAIMVGRLFPGFRTVSSIVAGLMGVHYFIFIFYTTLATVVWTTAWFLAGRFLGKHLDLLWRDIFSKPYLTLPGTILGAAVLFFLWRKIAQNNKSKGKQK